MTADAIDTAAVARPRTFFGQPVGLAYLAFTEAWERFSYYGMTSILVLYMSQALFTPGHVEHVAGFASLRAGLEAMLGPMTPLALASQIFGLYSGLVYFTPVFGGMIADRWIGRRKAVLLGAMLMSGGHIAMAFDASFLLALILLIVGCGFLKGNISAQVGQLYPEGDGEGRTRGFAVFSVAINIGAVGGPLVCGLLAQLYGWHFGFGLAGVLMLMGLATYVVGYRHLPEEASTRREAIAHAPLDRSQWRVVAALFAVMGLSVSTSIAMYQNTNIGLVWISRSVDLGLAGFHVPVAWFASIAAFASITCVPLLFALWRRQAARGREPGEIGKIVVGAWLAVAANLVLVLASLLGGRVPAFAPVVYNVLLGVSFVYYWPTMLALVSRAAPPQIRATLMGTVFLTLFLSNTIIGGLGGFYEQMTAAEFWGMEAAIAAAGGVLTLLLKRPLERVLLGGPAPPGR
jgi:POT family proton-dependent oligopeptide transporter